MRDFHRLQVWRRAHALAINVRLATARFPRAGYASLKTQIVTAAESIVFNIVEGAGASTQKEFARFLDISIKSAMELQAQPHLARDYGILERANWEALSTDLIATRRMTFGLRRAILESDVTVVDRA